MAVVYFWKPEVLISEPYIKISLQLCVHSFTARKKRQTIKLCPMGLKSRVGIQKYMKMPQGQNVKNAELLRASP